MAAVEMRLEGEMDGVRKSVVFTKATITLGRNSDNDIQVVDKRVSRYHCVFERAGSTVLLRDLKSANGTLVNGVLTAQATLSPSDVVLIGPMTLRLRLGGSAAPPVEELGADDLIDEAENLDTLAELIPAPSAAPARVVEDRVPMAGEEDVPTFAQVLETLGTMNRTLPVGLDSSDIALMNSRGQMTHESGPAKAQGRSEAVEILRLLLMLCFKAKASDLHLEPRQAGYAVRFRVNGSMADVVVLDTELASRVMSVVKVMCELDLGQRNIIQEGSFSARIPDRKNQGHRLRIDMRVSLAPAVRGQKLVIRVLDPTRGPQSISDLQLSEWMEAALRRAVKQDSGMILVCGPTGSGKTTTLVALVREIARGDLNTITIEDPVEMMLDGVTQIPVDEAQGNTFAALLRSSLRQDPDVIVVGEIRDTETTRMALQAASTGHLLFSTLHTKDTIGTIYRLLDLGAEPYPMAQALGVIMAQRLVRILCPACKEAYAPREEELTAMGMTRKDVPKLYRARSCARCLGTGYVGRRAVFEMLAMTEDLRDAISRSRPPGELRRIAEQGRFVTLSQAGYALAVEGLVDFEEVSRLDSRMP